MISIAPDQDDVFANDKNYVWKQLVKYYEFVEGAQLSNSFIILMVLNESKAPLSTTQISEMLAVKTNARIFRVSGALKDSLEKRLRRQGYVEGQDMPNINAKHKRVKITLCSITRKGKNLCKDGLAFSRLWINRRKHIVKRDAQILYVGVGKIHYNIMRYDDIMTAEEADALAGRAKTTSAQHYVLQDLKLVTNNYANIKYKTSKHWIHIFKNNWIGHAWSKQRKYSGFGSR